MRTSERGESLKCVRCLTAVDSGGGALGALSCAWFCRVEANLGGSLFLAQDDNMCIAKANYA